jgi:hypothetical protein
MLRVERWMLGDHFRFQFSPFLLSLSAVIPGTDLPFHFLPEKSLSPRRQARKGTISNPLGDLGGFARK